MDSRVGAFVKEIIASPLLGSQVVSHKVFSAVGPQYGQNHLPWCAAIQNLLQQKGLALYSHQTLATDHIRAGHSIVVATPTASGKSLIYNLPVLEQHLRDPAARALYLFPLKALAQDQAQSFKSLCATWPESARPSIAIYDGDTVDAERRKIRKEPPTALVTNPEMLHMAILPWHKNWATFLANLNMVVVDEAHTYRGIFGSHMAQVFRRLNRLASRYGASPVYIFCTATVANPVELASSLSGLPAEPVLVAESGAPAGARHFIFIDPINATSTCAIELLKAALARNLRVIVYCQSRRMTELISLWASSDQSGIDTRIASYRAGYLPSERRVIERKLAAGEIQAVVTTSALELGIDIGGLDVCILAGYPGTISQTLQRAGRVGRGGQESAVFLLTGEDALDQYFARHPEELFTRNPEKAILDPYNEVILKRHLHCAAAEQPLSANEPLLQDTAIAQAVDELCQEAILARTADGSQWVALDQKPHYRIELRGVGQSYSLQTDMGQIIGTIDGYRVWKEAHPGAIYLHRGRTYMAKEVDAGRARVVLAEEAAGWFTRARVKKDTVILEEKGRASFGRGTIFRGKLRISEQVTGYERRATSGNELLNIVPLDTPPHVYETDGIWFVIPDAIRNELEQEFLHFMGSIHAMEHAVIGLMPLEVMADRNDFAGISIPLHPQLGLPAVFVYDSLPGGAGLSNAVYPVPRRLLESTLKGVSGCACDDGCPSCIQSPRCGSGNRPLSKSGCIRLLRALLDEGKEGDDIVARLMLSPAGPAAVAPPRSPVTQRIAGGREEKPAVLNAPPTSYVVFDVETRFSAAEVGGWHKAEDMGVSIAVLYDSGEDAYYTYTQDQIGEMLERMLSAELIVGFNSLRFDYRVLSPYACPLDLARLPSLDLLQRIHQKTGLRISLDNLCATTLGSAKTANGTLALAWWKEGKLDLIASYCQKDVELTNRLYRYGREHGYVFYKNKAGVKVKIPVNFGL